MNLLQLQKQPTMAQSSLVAAYQRGEKKKKVLAAFILSALLKSIAGATQANQLESYC